MIKVAVPQNKLRVKSPSKHKAPFFAEGERRNVLKQEGDKTIQGSEKLQSLNKKITEISLNQKEHTPSEEIVKSTQNAVSVSPILQQSSQENTLQINKMSQIEPRKFKTEEFEFAIMNRLKEVVPKTKEEFERDPSSRERLQHANDEMNVILKSEQDNLGNEIESVSESPVSNEKINIHSPSELVTDQINETPKIANANIDPTLHFVSDANLSVESKEIDYRLQEEGVTENMLSNSNELSFNEALQLKQDSQARAMNTKVDYLNEASPIIQSTRDSTELYVSAGLANMYSIRSQNISSVIIKQQSSKTDEEFIRVKVAQELNSIFNHTKSKVDSNLKNLSSIVQNKFKIALKSANITFENNVKERTKTGLIGAIVSWISGIPKDIELIFNEEQRMFINSLQPTIREIGEYMESELNKAMNLIETGKQQIQNYWNNQDEQTQRISEDLFVDATKKYFTLEQQVNDTNTQLQKDITLQFNEAATLLVDTFERIKEENKNWIERAKDTVVGVIAAIVEMKNMLLGILHNAFDTVMVIITNPILFLSNLLSAVKMGFLGFVERIGTYIKKGLIAWLLGNMPSGVVLPETWNLKGIFTFVASVIGLTWENIKKRATLKFGPAVVKALETTFEVFVIIKEQGIVGLWEFIKEKLINLKDQVLGSIQDMLITQVVKAGVVWIISLFNPAGAFIKACKLIYDVISWFINNARRLLELVQSIVNSVALIAAGSLNAAAQFVERSLANTVPIVIGFLARLLGIGDLSERVQKIIDSIREPINKAIDWVLEKAKNIAQRLVSAGKKGANIVAGWLGLRKGYKSVDGVHHELFFEEVNGKPVLMRASVKSSFQSYIESIRSSIEKYNNRKDIPKKINLSLIMKKFTFIRDNMADYNDFKKNNISDKMNKLAILLSELPEDIVADNNIFFPEHKVTFDPIDQSLSSSKSSEDGSRMQVSFLSFKLGDLRGSPGKHTSKLYTHIRDKIEPHNQRFLIRGHLLNHYLGGSGDEAKNIAPISDKTNKAMERRSENVARERVAKKGLLSGSVFDYMVEIGYKNSKKYGDIEIPSKIEMKIQNRKFLYDNKEKRTKENMEKQSNWIPDGDALVHSLDAKSELEALAK